jgi:hypothetical protein
MEHRRHEQEEIHSYIRRRQWVVEGGRPAGGGEGTIKVKMAEETSMRDNGKEKE